MNGSLLIMFVLVALMPAAMGSASLGLVARAVIEGKPSSYYLNWYCGPAMKRGTNEAVCSHDPKSPKLQAGEPSAGASQPARVITCGPDLIMGTNQLVCR